MSLLIATVVTGRADVRALRLAVSAVLLPFLVLIADSEVIA